MTLSTGPELKPDTDCPDKLKLHTLWKVDELMAADQLSREELAEFREIFNLVDRDGGGSISKEELGELMDTLGINASQEEVDLMIELTKMPE